MRIAWKLELILTGVLFSGVLIGVGVATVTLWLVVAAGLANVGCFAIAGSVLTLKAPEKED